MSQTILITGCSSGIGKTAALMLRDRGYRVFASARRDKDLADLNNEGLETVALDLSDSQSVERCVADVLERCGGKLDALFNNGAYGQGGALEDLERTHLTAQFETNFFGWHDLTRRIIPLMRQQKYGRIILNSSLLGYVALPFRGAYTASKYALEGWADTLRMELKGSGISVILIEPGPIATRFRANSMRVFKQTIQARHSFHRRSYETLLHRLASDTPMPFTLASEAVAAKLIAALENKHPKTRYRVTIPSHLLWYMKKIFSDRLMQYCLMQVKN